MFRVFLLVCAVVFLAVPLSGEELPSSPQRKSDSKTNDLQQLQVLREITALRKSMGGSVLKGSLLAPGDQNDADFQSGLKAMLQDEKSGQEKSFANTKQKQAASSSAKVGGQPHSNSTLTTVSTLRRQCSALDKIANEMEMLRHYQQADALRDISNKLRQLARQLDSRCPAPPVRQEAITSSSKSLPDS